MTHVLRRWRQLARARCTTTGPPEGRPPSSGAAQEAPPATCAPHHWSIIRAAPGSIIAPLMPVTDAGMCCPSLRTSPHQDTFAEHTLIQAMTLSSDLQSLAHHAHSSACARVLQQQQTPSGGACPAPAGLVLLWYLAARRTLGDTIFFIMHSRDV